MPGMAGEWLMVMGAGGSGPVAMLLGAAAMALLFALVGVLPLQHRTCDACTGDCTRCPLDEEDR